VASGVLACSAEITSLEVAGCASPDQQAGADLAGFVGLVLAGYRALLLTRRARDRI
jgi:hypothetical protein